MVRTQAGWNDAGLSRDDSAIRFHEYPDADLPEVFRIQVLDFLRLVWPDGFTGLNRFRDWTTDPDMKPHHPLYAADSRLISHLEVIATTVSVNTVKWRAASPTTSEDVLLTRPTSPSSARFLRDIKDHPPLRSSVALADPAFDQASENLVGVTPQLIWILKCSRILR